MNVLETQIMKTFVKLRDDDVDKGVWLDIHLPTWDDEIKFLLEEDIIFITQKDVVSHEIGDYGRYNVYGLTTKGLEFRTFAKDL